MPDLRTAFQKAINEHKEKHMNTQSELKNVVDHWDDEVDSAQYTITPTLMQSQTPAAKPSPFRFGRIGNNISRATFNTIRDNPNKTSSEICAILKKQGYGTSSVSSLIYQMVRNGMVSRTPEGRVSTTLKEYQPIKNLNALTRKQNTTGIAALPAPQSLKETKPKVAAPATGKVDIPTLLNTLTLKEAVELFVALQDMFNSTRKA